MSDGPGPASPADVDAVAHCFVDRCDDTCEVTGQDGHHLQRVRRLHVGEVVTAADGSGSWRPYLVAATRPGLLTLEACGDARVEPVPAVSIAVAVALTKGGLESVVTAVTELGATRVTPLRTERTVARWHEDKAEQALSRLRRNARAAAMQARRARVPEIDHPVDVAAIAARPDVVVADRDGRPASELVAPGSGVWTVVVGPEGGLSDDERAQLGAHPSLALGPFVLRASTAPVAAVAVLSERITQLRHA